MIKIRVLVCGGRNCDPYDVEDWLFENGLSAIAKKLNIDEKITISYVIEGEAQGADEGARLWAENSGYLLLKFRANWKYYGKSAGPIRNEQMLLEGCPNIVIAFRGGKGTAHMVKIALQAGIPVIEVNENLQQLLI